MTARVLDGEWEEDFFDFVQGMSYTISLGGIPAVLPAHRTVKSRDKTTEDLLESPGMTEILLFYIQKEQRNAVFLSQNHREIVGDDELFREDFPAVYKSDGLC